MDNHLRASQSVHAKSTIHLCGIIILIIIIVILGSRFPPATFEPKLMLVYCFEFTAFSLTLGASVNHQTTMNDHTVLSLACAGGHLAVVELLLRHGADPLHKLKVRMVSVRKFRH